MSLFSVLVTGLKEKAKNHFNVRKLAGNCQAAEWSVP